uniref:RNA polymerase subunit alpha n=1 Tax=Reclinomonas americana ATCC 50284 TaxID=1295595 RepID=M4QAS4_RECAM|nr:RNA polymerase subunit alpha [Reclinomonas americana ATCC 50284]
MVYQTPSFRPKIQNLKYDSHSIQVLIGPLEKNFSGSFANILRKVIYRFTPGVGIIGLKVNSVDFLHAYSSLPGIQEDIPNLFCNLKNLVIKIDKYDHKPFNLIIKKKGPYIIKGEDILCPLGVTILNKNVYICTVESDCQIDLTLIGDVGCGYVLSNYFGNKKNTIYSDTVFCPIKHVSYYVRSYTTYEELILYVKTNGTCDPNFVLKNAFSFLQDKVHFKFENV